MSNSKKLSKTFGEGSFGMPDLPRKIGLGHYAHLEHDASDSMFISKAHRRSWKRHRKQRWRSK